MIIALGRADPYLSIERVGDPQAFGRIAREDDRFHAGIAQRHREVGVESIRPVAERESHEPDGVVGSSTASGGRDIQLVAHGQGVAARKWTFVDERARIDPA